MLLSAQLLSNVSSVNDYTEQTAIKTTQGDPFTLSLRLVDLSKDTQSRPVGRRYMPASGSVVTVIFQNIDDEKKIRRVATQPFPTSDPSIFEVPVLSEDDLVGTVNVGLELQEGDNLFTGGVRAAILANPRGSVYSQF